MWSENNPAFCGASEINAIQCTESALIQLAKNSGSGISAKTMASLRIC